MAGRLPLKLRAEQGSDGVEIDGANAGHDRTCGQDQTTRHQLRTHDERQEDVIGGLRVGTHARLIGTTRIAP